MMAPMGPGQTGPSQGMGGLASMLGGGGPMPPPSPVKRRTTPKKKTAVKAKSKGKVSPAKAKAKPKAKASSPKNKKVQLPTVAPTPQGPAPGTMFPRTAQTRGGRSNPYSGGTVI